MGEEDNTETDELPPVHLAYLKSLKKVLDKQMETNFDKVPDCIKSGDGWIRPADPYYILKSQNHPDPYSIIHPDLYVNIPHLKIALFCSCKRPLFTHGWAPNFRKVVCLDRVWYLLSKRYICDKRRDGCGRSFVGHSPAIISQLPMSCQISFPAHLTQRLGISKLLFDLLRPCFHNRLGPGPLHNVLRELHTKRYDNLHLAYLEAIIFRLQNPTPFNQLNPYPSFPEFLAADGYGGYVPSSGYLSGVYNVIQSTFQKHRDQHLSMLEGTILSSDFSHKLPSRIAKVNGHPMFTAVHSMMNNYGELRLHNLVATKSLQPLVGSIKNMLNSLQRYGHPQPELLFVDDVRGEGNFFTKNIPSLTKNVQPLSLDPYPHLEEYQLPSNVKIVVANTLNQCSQYLDAHIIDCLDSATEDRIVIGLDCEWCYDQFLGSGKVALCQIAREDIVIIIQLHLIGHIPDSLKLILTSKRIIKVGRNVGGDVKRLQQSYPFLGETNGTLELGKLCREQGIVTNGTAGLDTLCAFALKRKLPKPTSIRVGMDWENLILSEEQIRYAAKDAYVSLEIYKAAITSDIVGVVPSFPRADQPVQVLSKDMKTVAATGVIVLFHEPIIDGIKITKTRIMVRIDQILAPGAFIPLHQSKL